MTEPVEMPGDAGRWGDLAVRVASAVVLIGVAGAAVWTGGIWFMALVMGVCAVMIWELANMTAPNDPFNSIGLAVIAAIGVFAVNSVSAPLAYAFLALPVVGLIGTPRQYRIAASVIALCIMTAGFTLFYMGYYLGMAPILWLLGVVIASDVLGYLVGRQVGGPKFWPAISPKKTWSGTIAGWVGAGLVGLGFYLGGFAPISVIALSVVIGFAGQIGDIGESWLKRRLGVKDASNLIPGHGGFMDRFDAMTGALVAIFLIGRVISLPIPTGF